MLLTPIISLVCLGIDIATFFLLVRLVQAWKACNWLAPFNKAGKSLVDSITATTGNLASSKFNKELSDRGKLLVSFGILMLVKFIIASSLKLFV